MYRPLTLAVIACSVAFSGQVLADAHMSFDKVDTDANGQVTFEEGKVVHTEWTEEAFAALDSDGNGTLSKEEYKAAMAAAKEKK